MLARYLLSSCVRSSVCLSHAGIVSKWLKMGSRKQCDNVRDSPRTVVFWRQQSWVGNDPFPLKFALKVTHPFPLWTQQFRPISVNNCVTRNSNVAKIFIQLNDVNTFVNWQNDIYSGLTKKPLTAVPFILRGTVNEYYLSRSLMRLFTLYP